MSRSLDRNQLNWRPHPTLAALNDLQTRLFRNTSRHHDEPLTFKVIIFMTNRRTTQRHIAMDRANNAYRTSKESHGTWTVVGTRLRMMTADDQLAKRWIRPDPTVVGDFKRDGATIVSSDHDARIALR